MASNSAANKCVGGCFECFVLLFQMQGLFNIDSEAH
jgi:hypothetical protein